MAKPEIKNTKEITCPYCGHEVTGAAATVLKQKRYDLDVRRIAEHKLAAKMGRGREIIAGGSNSWEFIEDEGSSYCCDNCKRRYKWGKYTPPCTYWSEGLEDEGDLKNDG